MAPRQRSTSPQTPDQFEERVPMMEPSVASSSRSSERKSDPVKPIIKETEADIARDQHDFFNLFALVCTAYFLRLDLVYHSFMCWCPHALFLRLF
jgi:hypothetical protein